MKKKAMRRAALSGLLAAGLVAAPSDSSMAQETVATRAAALAAHVPALERNLRENVTPFWFPRTLDTEHGGYLIHHGPDGQPLPGGIKMIVSQSRQLWLASRLLRSRHAEPGLRDAADHGFRFLRDRMWDQTHGGFVWSVDRTAAKVIDPNKHLYGQAFALYALAEYSIATGSADARTLALRLFDLLEATAYDREFGGYREFFAADWSAPGPGVNSPLGAPADMKLMNTHMHLMEAFTTFVRAGAPPRVRERLAEMVTIETQAVIRRQWMAGTDRHHRDWTPVLDPMPRMSYGHDVENVWLVADALDALDQPTAPYHELFRGLFEHALRFGWDDVHGGFYENGFPGQPADRLAKIWWVQAEAMVGALAMFEMTGDARYIDVFTKTWQFVDRVQTDWATGEWHEAIQPDGQPRGGNKATPWKAGYHNGRALLESIERIERLTR